MEELSRQIEDEEINLPEKPRNYLKSIGSGAVSPAPRTVVYFGFLDSWHGVGGAPS